FKGEKLDDARIDSRMKTQPAFVRAERTIHLYAKAAVHLNLSFVVNPRDAKLNHSFRFDQTLQNSGVSELLTSVDDWSNGLQHLRDSLKKLRLVRVTFSDDFENFLNQSHKFCGLTSCRVNGKIWCAMLVSNQRPLA